MPSPFEKYKGEQVQQISPAFTQGHMAGSQALAQGISTAAQGIANGITGYYKHKEDMEVKQATAQGLVDSYTNGDYESAMFNDSTPNHVRSFLGKAMEAGGMANLKPLDINAFLAGEQAYSTQLDRSYKQQAIDIDRIKATGANAPKPVDATKSFNLGTDISKTFSPSIQQSAGASVPSAPEILSGMAATEAEAAAGKIDLAGYNREYQASREDLAYKQTAAPDLQGVSDISQYQAQLEREDTERTEAMAKAQRDLETLKLKEQESKALQFDVFRRTLNDPAYASRAIEVRKNMILQSIQKLKQSLGQSVDTSVYGKEAAVVAGQVTADDIKEAEVMARNFPMGTTLRNPDGSGYIFENGQFNFRSAEQMKGPKVDIQLPAGFDPTKPFGGFSQEVFAKQPIDVQDKMIDQMKNMSTIANNNVQTAINTSQLNASTFTAAKAFGWSGTIPDATQRRKASELIAGRRMTDQSIDMILAAYSKGVGRAVDPQTRAVFRATRPFLIASIRPMVAGGNQQSNMELINILAAIPEGENITSLRPFEEAQYRLLKVMYSRQFDNFMAAQQDMRYEGGQPAAVEWQSLNNRTRTLVEEFMSGSGQFSGMDNVGKMTALQLALRSAYESGNPYLDGQGKPILLGSFNKGLLTGEVREEPYVNQQINNSLNDAEQKANEDPNAREIIKGLPSTPLMERLTR